MSVNADNLINSAEYIRSRGFASAHEAASAYIMTYTMLQRTVPDFQGVLDYMTSMQGADGLWGGRHFHYSAELAIILAAYDWYGERPPISLDSWFQSINTWTAVLADRDLYEDPQNPWGGLWGYAMAWIVYYNEEPPWINEYMAALETDLASWLPSMHNRSHVYFTLFTLQRALPHLDEVITNTVNGQNANGSWGDWWTPGNMNETCASAVHMLRGIIEGNFAPARNAEMEQAIANAIPFIEACYVEAGTAPVLGYFTDVPGGTGDPVSLWSGVMGAVDSLMLPGFTDPLWTHFQIPTVTHTLTVNSVGVPAAVPFTIDGFSEVTPYSAVLGEGSHTIVMPTGVTVGTDVYNFVQWEDGSTNPTRTINLVADMTITSTYELAAVPEFIFATCDALVDDSPDLPPGWTWMMDRGSYSIVSDGTQVEGTGFIRTHAVEEWNYYFAKYAGGVWDPTGREIVVPRLRTNHPEIRIECFVITAEGAISWTTYQLPDINLVTPDVWTEVERDMRGSPQGYPDFTQFRGVQFAPQTTGAFPADYYLDIDYITLRQPTTPTPLGCLVSPGSLACIVGNIYSLTTRAWGGTAPYAFVWYLDGVEVARDTTSYSFFAEEAMIGSHQLFVEVMDDAGTVVQSNTVPIDVVAAPPPPVPTRPIHCEGNLVLDDLGTRRHLRGVLIHGHADHPNGNWQDRNGNLYWHIWDPVVVQEELDGIRQWGANLIRIIVSAELWQYNMDSYREKIKSFLTFCHERGIYVIFAGFTIRYYGMPGARQTPIPYPPHLNAEEQAAVGWTSSADFVNWWTTIATELLAFPNVLFELWNEPGGGIATDANRIEWFGVVQNCISAIRATGSNHCIVVQWDYGTDWWFDTGAGHTMHWVFDHPLTDPEANIVYSTHSYRDYGQLGSWGAWDTRQPAYRRVDIESAFQQMRVFEVAQSFPLLIGETGTVGLPSPRPAGPPGDPTDAVTAELTALENLLAISNDNGFHWSVNHFWYELGQALIYANQPNYQPTEGGEKVIAALAAVPPPQHTLTVNSTPTGIPYTRNGTQFTTPYTETLTEGQYAIGFPSNAIIGTDTYNFVQWEDGSTNPTRTIDLVADMTITATYEIVTPPPEKGYIQVHAFLNGDEITADGTVVETAQTFQTPTVPPIEVDPGTYTLQLSYAGATSPPYTVTVEANQTLRVDAQFTPIPAPQPNIVGLIIFVGFLWFVTRV